MPLRDLYELMESLGRRIDEHRSAFSQNEALTRYALIDPLLRALGWDTEDPSQVVPEYRTSGGGAADYALLAPDAKRPVMIVEAKSLGSKLQDKARAQGINYCLIGGVKYFSVTDGQRWEMYETHKPVEIDGKRITQFDVKNDPAQACLRALALWRQSISIGVVEAGLESIQPQPRAPARSVDQPDTRRAASQAQPPLSVGPGVAESQPAAWRPLSTYEHTKHTMPREIQFAENYVREVKYWYELVMHAVQWLHETGRLRENAPLPSFLSTTGGRGFRRPLEVNGTPFTFERHGNPKAHISHSKWLIERCGAPWADVRIRLKS